MRRVVRARVRQALLRMAESCGVAHQSPLPSPVAVPARQSLCMESPLESFNKPRQSRPVFVGVTRQRVVRRHPPSMPKSSAVRARVRPRVPIVQSAKVFRPVFVHRVPAKLFLGCPVLVKPQSSAVPATVARHPTVYIGSTVPVSSGVRCRPSAPGRPRAPPGSSAVPGLGFIVLAGATSCHVVFSGGHILPCGF